MADTPAPTVVLLAEDEALVRMFAADLLRDEAGFKVIEAVNADEALTVLEATSDVRALVTDVEMPGSLDGFTLARLVHKAWPHIGIVVVSARVGPGPGDMPLGARFVAKPYSTTALIDAVNAVLDARSGPILLPDATAAEQRIAPETVPATEPPRPLLPVGLSIDPLQAAIGSVGGLAQPLSEPDE
jgi:two-component system, response regulator PdtaR